MKKAFSSFKKLLASALLFAVVCSLCSCNLLSEAFSFYTSEIPDYKLQYSAELESISVYSESDTDTDDAPSSPPTDDETQPPEQNPENAPQPEQNSPQSSSENKGSSENNGGGTSNGTDFISLINTISTDTIKACVNITTGEYSSQFSTTPTSSSLGSGVIFYGERISGGYRYYVLTNYHVVELSETCRYYRYDVSDYLGNTEVASRPQFTGTVSETLDELNEFCKSHDLAILEFKTSQQLKIISLDTQNPEVGQTVISIGQPSGQKNTITIGSVESYDKVTIQNSTSPNFNVIAHDAPIDHGNSGGALINTEHELVGINFAGSFKNGVFSQGYSIPIEKVISFLETYGFNF